MAITNVGKVHKCLPIILEVSDGPQASVDPYTTLGIATLAWPWAAPYRWLYCGVRGVTNV